MVDEDRNFFDTQATLFKFQRCAGFMFYEIEDGNKLIFSKRSKLILVIYLIIHTIISVILVELETTVLANFMGIPSMLEKLACMLHVSFDLSFVLMECILSKAYNTRTLHVLNQLYAVEKDLKRMDIDVKYVLGNRWIGILSLYLILLLAHFILANVVDYTSARNMLFCLYWSFVFSFISLTHISLTSQFLNTFFIAKDMLYAVNCDFLKKFTYEVPDDEMMTTRELENLKLASRIYQDIFTLLRDFNGTTSIRILLLFATCFSWITIIAFNFVMTIGASGFSPAYNYMAVYSLFAFVHVTIIIGTFVLACEMYYKEVSALKTVLFNAVNQVKVEELRKEITMISLQIAHEDYEIKIAGFFVINIKLVASIVSAITMYTIVLMQFNPNAGVFRKYMHDHLS